MRFTKLISATIILGTSLGAPLAGHFHRDKRDVVTVQAVVTVIQTSSVMPIQENIVEPTSPSVTTTFSMLTQSAPTLSPDTASISQKSIIESQVSTQSYHSTSTSEELQSSSSPTSNSVSGAGALGISYSPYSDDGGCKSADQVASDLAYLRDYQYIRLYGVDCDQVANVMKSKGTSQKLFLGLYHMDQIQYGVDSMRTQVQAWGSWDDVVTVSVGNELVNAGTATPDEVGNYVATAKSALANAGYTGPIVAVDTFIAVIEHPELCQYSDYMAVNAHAYFDRNTLAQDAGPWVLQQIQRVWDACGGAKSVTVTESGWPSQGDTLGKAVPSKANQQAAINSIKESCGSDTYLFSAFNDLWKANGPYNVEKYWGIY